MDVLGVSAYEGVVGMVDDHFAGESGEFWQACVDVNERLCCDPSIVGVAPHLLAVGRESEGPAGCP